MRTSHTAAVTPDRAVSSIVSSTKQDFLVFRLGGKEYGIDLEKVQELCGYEKVTPLADTPQFIAGVLPLHSRKVPIVDMHAMLAPGSAENSMLTDVIVLHSNGRVSGIAVDCVIDVVTLRPTQVKAASGTETDGGFLIGTGTLEQRVMVLLDAEKLMTDFRPGPSEKLAA